MATSISAGHLTPAERHQIERHKYYLSEQAGHDVGVDTAREDWLANVAPRWRKRRLEHMLRMQRAEIARYRWIRSEEARQDLGRAAAMEWVQKHAATWRRWYENNFLDI